MAWKKQGEVDLMSDPTGFLKWSDVKRMIGLAKTEKTRDYLLLRVLLGRRVSEVVRKYGIRPMDINPPNIINFLALKRKERKRYPLKMNEDLGMRLAEYCRRKNIPQEKPIFPISRQRVFQIVRKYGERCGIERVGQGKLHPHHLRHSYAIHFASKAKTPMDIYKLQQRLMHADVNMTMWYLRTIDQGEDYTDVE